ncbi:MAG TPA: tripartite tricarboxylate transporter substrate binding protein, partial [Ramlibacter sp.]|nr:tripartite tricarboxylate transporter substrate binding protein [Ramlibacter sp.]
LMLALASAAPMVFPLAARAQAEDWPRKPITIVAPLPAGSGTDAVARLLAQGMSNEYKVPVVVDNKVGANGFLAARYVAKAPPDGYTLFFTGNTTHSSNEHMYKQLPYDPVKDFSPVSLAFKGFMVLMVNASSPAKSIADLVSMGKKAPGKLSFATGSSSGRLSAEMFRQMAGLDFVHVPYKGNPQALTDLIGGQVDFMFTDGSTTLAQLNAGRVRALAVTSPQRHPRLPNVPTMEELGFNGYEVSIWSGLYTPAGAPPAVIDKLNATMRRVLASPELKEWGNNAVFDMVASTPAGLAQIQAAESERTRRVLRAAGIEPE